MYIFEIFNSKLDLGWQQSGRYELTTFQVNEIEYLIQVEKINGIIIDDNLKQKRVAEVSFSLHAEANIERSFSTASFNSAASKIYGIVFHALLEKFSNYDAFYFSAERRHSKTEAEYKIKQHIYSFLGNYLAKKIDGYFYKSKNQGDSIFIATKIQLSLENSKFISELAEAKKCINT